jgi:hypothetical protein
VVNNERSKPDKQKKQQQNTLLTQVGVAIHPSRMHSAPEGLRDIAVAAKRGELTRLLVAQLRLLIGEHLPHRADDAVARRHNAGHVQQIQRDALQTPKIAVSHRRKLRLVPLSTG